MDEIDKKSALDLLYYEFWMLSETYGFLSNESNKSKINAFLESFLLHSRNLADFLEDRKDDRDIKCSDFGINRITINLPIENNLKKINKYLAHITKERLITQKPKWTCGKIKKEIVDGIKSFINKLPLEIWPTKKGRNKSDFELFFKEKCDIQNTVENIIDTCSDC